MNIYHKIGEYYGVLVDGVTLFSGSFKACEEYVKLFS